MKSNLPSPYQTANPKSPPPQTTEPKFVYNKRKFSSPQFFLKSPIPSLNSNLFSGIFSPQSTKNPRQNNISPKNTTADKNIFTPFQPKINPDSDLTSKPKIKNQITKNDSFYPTENQTKPHHNFAKLQTNPNQQNVYEKVSYFKHRRILSEPTDLRKKQITTKNDNLHKNVLFNDEKIKTNIATLRRQTRKRDERSNSSSILKNKNRRSKILSVDAVTTKAKIKTDETSSISSDDMKEEINERQNNVNKMVRKKYDNIMNNLVTKLKQPKILGNAGLNQKRVEQQRNIKQSQKFTDSQFPPNQSSLFGYQNLLLIKQGKLPVEKIKWVRIQQLFPKYKLSIFEPSPGNESQIIVAPSLFGSHQLACAMNAIKNCRSLLTKIFETQTINNLGIYILKIFQENSWKYIIIDDKIPVVENPINSKKTERKLKTEEKELSYQPAFLKLELSKNASRIQIWPLLLEKAYASLYSNYVTFHIGNQLDYLEQITGTPGIIVDFKALIQNLQSLKYLEAEFKNSQVFGLGHKPNEERLYPIFSSVSSRQIHKKVSLVYCDPKNNFEQNSLAYQRIPFQFPKFCLFSYQKHLYCSHCIVGHYKKGALINKPGKSQKGEYSIRQFCLEGDSQVVFSINQKQKRFYENSSFKYEYMWVRVILVEREFNGDYRWITGKYSCDKSISFQTYLSSGKYCLIVMPEWRQTHSHQLNVFLWSNFPQIKLVNKSYEPEQRIIQKACMDLAQRKGKLSQVNAFICSYNYLNEDVGMIIENINNERTLGSVKVMRSINGLKASVDIVPINKEFYQIGEEEKKRNTKKFKTNITINIPQESSFTVVLKMKGGIDKKFFQVFDFGN